MTCFEYQVLTVSYRTLICILNASAISRNTDFKMKVTIYIEVDNETLKFPHSSVMIECSASGIHGPLVVSEFWGFCCLELCVSLMLSVWSLNQLSECLCTDFLILGMPLYWHFNIKFKICFCFEMNICVYQTFVNNTSINDSVRCYILVRREKLFGNFLLVLISSSVYFISFYS